MQLVVTNSTLVMYCEVHYCIYTLEVVMLLLLARQDSYFVYSSSYGHLLSPVMYCVE